MFVRNINIFAFILVLCSAGLRVTANLRCLACENCDTSSTEEKECTGEEECVRYELVAYRTTPDEYKNDINRQVIMGCASQRWCEKMVQQARVQYHNDTIAHARCYLCKEDLCNANTASVTDNSVILPLLLFAALAKLW